METLKGTLKDFSQFRINCAVFDQSELRFIVECIIHEVILPISLHSVPKTYEELRQITELPLFQSDIDECSAITNHAIKTLIVETVTFRAFVPVRQDLLGMEYSV